VVPVSDQLLTEICHQADLATRRATATIIDELSDGVTIVGFSRRSDLEFLEWAHASLHKGHSLPLLTVWTTLPNVLQSRELHLDGADPALSAAFTKAMEDINDAFRLADLIPSLDTLTFDAANGQAFAHALTANKRGVGQVQPAFEELFQQEADRYLSMILPKMPEEVITELEHLAARHNEAGADLVDGVRAVFWAQHRSGSHPQALPGLRIIAGCASRITAEPDRKFKHGDQGDIFHAYAAIPYCNVFLTDASTRHLVTSTPTDLSSRYQCTVLADPAQAVDHLQRLVA